MNPKTVQFQYNINRMDAVDLIATIHIDDCDTRFLEVLLFDRDGALDVSGSTATARFVTQSGFLLDDSVPCTVSGNAVTVPIDAAAVQSQACTLQIEINITKGGKVLTLPFPLFVRVRGSILDDAQITPESEGTIPELLKRVREELKRVKVYVDEVQLWEAFDLVMSGSRNVAPSLYFERKGNSYALCYDDSDGGEHELFDFGVLPMTYVLTAQDKADIANIVLGELPTVQGVLYGDANN